ncbi:S8 family peptidase [Salipiger bermudensis]|uniref:S8 family peptidase n=1 Tax=Salipiger bermudensis TaxID=344736 RepID=UPI001A8E2E43|nr:S8 family peptidase [Salipiger bermudensis]MBN9678808.1 S8 family serine peptidase [Salipiger bermudensis]
MRTSSLITAAALLAAHVASAQPIGDLRSVPPSDAYILADDAPVDAIILKFREGSAIRLEGARFALGERSTRDEQAMRRIGLTAGDMEAALRDLDRLVGGAQNVTLEDASPVFSNTPDDLQRLRETGERRSGKALADLTLYHSFALPGGTVYAEVAELVAALNALPIVEISYAVPPGTDPQADAPPATPDFEFQQGYLDPAPGGIDARYGWTVPGGTGAGVRIIDVEQGITPDHEDLPPLVAEIGPLNPQSSNHGSAVMGVLVGAENGYGVTGIAHGAEAGFVSHFGPATMAQAVLVATLLVEDGDIIVIEIQRRGPVNGQPCLPGCNVCTGTATTPAQDDSIPIEFWQANFDAIQTATANGVIVVAAAGNGGSDLDDPVYYGQFDRTVRDSAAIIVGAGDPVSHAPSCFTNYGDRVDLQGWGRGVTTLGYGGLFDGLGPPSGPGLLQQSYTANFSGTSSATPIVAGAAAAVQGAVLAAGGDPLTSIEMREVLRAGATPQAADARDIGPLPNLRGAIDRALHPECGPPASGDWIVSDTCVVSRNLAVPANVDVEDGASLIVLPRVTLDIVLRQHSLEVRPEGQVFVHPSGRIR